MNDNQRYFVEEFAEEYLAGRMNRRDLLRRVLLITGGAGAAAAALLALGCGSTATPQAPSSAATPEGGATPAGGTGVTPSASPSATGLTTMPPAAQTTAFVVQPDDPAIRVQNVQYTGQAGTIFGYLAQPRSGPAAPGLIVVPENRGLVEPNMDIARRYAKEGFVALAVDLVSRSGGTAKYAEDPAQIPAALANTPQADLVTDLQSSLTYLKTVDGVRTDRLGVTGFCFGGNQTFALATASPAVLAAVPYYGTVNPASLAPSKAAFFCFYGALDTRVTSTAQATQQALQAAGRTVEIHIEPGAMHAFFNNTGTAFNPAAAQDAWPRSVAWFNTYLKA